MQQHLVLVRLRYLTHQLHHFLVHQLHLYQRHPQRRAAEVADQRVPRSARRLDARDALITKIVQGWPKLWANFRNLIGIFSQSAGPSLAIWANPVQFSSMLSSRRVPARVIANGGAGWHGAPPSSTATAGRPSNLGRGRGCHLDAPRYMLYGETRMKFNG